MNGNIQIRILQSTQEMHAAEDLQSLVWEASPLDVIPGHLALAISHNGGVVAGAFDGEELVGLVLGFIGTDAQSPGRVAMARLKHYSHELAVHPDYRNRGIGYALKLAQRELVIKQGIRLISWTYDPLLSVNAQLNIRRLGAICSTYIKNAYGEMRDGINVGDQSDRFHVDWWITSKRVQTRLTKERKPLDLAHFLSAGAEKVNPTKLDARDLLLPSEKIYPAEGTFALVEIPPNYQEMKSIDPGLAGHWREQTREIFTDAFRRGYLVTDFIHLREEKYPRSYYLLSYGEGTLG
ncbi:MAG: GNAT family N-acetyltransferase [Anaerolineales bacterium]|jgi:predicted GNAT superfamily acetyltransferase